MRWEIEWVQEATAELQVLWDRLSSEGEDQWLVAYDNMVEQLQSDPHANSEGRNNNHRIMFESPLAVLYEVDSSRLMIVIKGIWRIT